MKLSCGQRYGLLLDDKPARVSSTSDLDSALLLATDSPCAGKTDLAQPWKICAIERCVAHLGRLLRTHARRYRPRDVMLDPVMNIWDCAALSIMKKRAAHLLTGMAGERCGGSEFPQMAWCLTK